MLITDLQGDREVKEIGELEEILSRRDRNGFNSFWLSHGNGLYPVLSILVKNEFAALHYMPQEYVAGFSSEGHIPALKKDGETAFVISNSGEQIWVTNDAIVEFSTALNAAKEFFQAEELPKSIRWFEL